MKILLKCSEQANPERQRSQSVVAWVRGKEIKRGMGVSIISGCGAAFWGDKKDLKLDWLWLYKPVIILKTNESYILNRLTAWYVKNITINLFF